MLGTCRRFVGTVIAVRHEQDGDYHVVIAPSPGFGSYLDSTNRSVQHGGIVAEIMPGQALRAPGVGAHVVVVGTWALDLMHGWNEIHPIWAMDTGSGLVKALPPVTPVYNPNEPRQPLSSAVSSPPATSAGSNCTRGYSPCLPLGPSDYDCYGGSGDGPAYTAPGVVYQVTGSDPYRLDGNGNGLGCE